MRPATPLLAKTPFAIDSRPLDGALTPFAGLAGVSRAFRSLKIPGQIEANLPLKQRDRGLSPAQYIECLSLLQIAGGECKEDMEKLRGDQGLEKILGYQPPSARSLGDFLEKFHDPDRLERGKAKAERQRRLAFIPEENEALSGLGRVLSGTVAAINRQGEYPSSATIDEDATIIESYKHTAEPTYDGRRGYQPMVAVWAESGLIVADEFRNGNVPANMEPLNCARRAFNALPSHIQEYYFRGDSACHEHNLIEWLNDPQREDGPKGFIGFAISARLSEDLAKALRKVSERGWKTFDQDRDGTVRQWAEIDFVPADRTERKDSSPLRYIGLRLVKAQGDLFADGEKKKHFAVLTNRTESAETILRWQRLKAGTIEHVHDELKNGLAAGRLPSAKFGANAAWFRLSCLIFNLVEALRRNWPDESLRTAKLKRLRFEIFSVTGRITRDRRKISLRLAASKTWIRRLVRFFQSFPLITRSTG